MAKGEPPDAEFCPQGDGIVAYTSTPPQVETLYQACEWQLWDAERFRKLVKNEEEAHVWVSRLAVLLFLDNASEKSLAAAYRSNWMGQQGQYVLAV